MAIKHSFTSAKSDSADPTIVSASHWNASHTIEDSTITEAKLSLSDVTTANASTSNHGFLKKLDNISTHFLNGQGNWATPSGTGGGSDTMYNVTDYGAVGDNSTNDYTAIYDACAAASAANGGTVYFPPGIYVMGSTLTVPEYVNLQGEGGFDVTTTSSFKGSWIKGNVRFKKYSRFADLKIGGTSTSASFSAASVSPAGSDDRHDIICERVRFRGGDSSGESQVVNLPDSVNGDIYNITFRDCIFECSQGIYGANLASACFSVTSNDEVSTAENRYNITLDHCHIGAYNGDYTGAKGFMCVFWTGGLTTGQVTNQYTHDLKVTDCLFEEGDQSILDFACAGNGDDDVASEHFGYIVTGNIFLGAGRVHTSTGMNNTICVESMRRGIIANNYFLRSYNATVKTVFDYGTGIGTGQQCIIANNIFDQVRDTSLSATAGNTAIEILGKENLITGNIIIQDGTSNSRAIAFRGSDGDAVRNVCTNNTIIRTATTSQGIIECEYGGDNIIRGNTIFLDDAATCSAVIKLTSCGTTPGTIVQDNVIHYAGASTVIGTVGSGNVYKKNNFYKYSGTYQFTDS